MQAYGQRHAGAADPLVPLVHGLFTPGWRNPGAGSFWAGFAAARPGVAALPSRHLPAVLGVEPFLAGVLTCR